MSQINFGKWNSEENLKFIEALKTCQKWKEIAEAVGTRSTRQCRTHYQKVQQKMLKNGRTKGRVLESFTQSTQINEFKILKIQLLADIQEDINF